VDLAAAYFEVDAFENLFVANRGVEVGDFKKYIAHCFGRINGVKDGGEGVLTYGAFECDCEESLSLDGKLHWEFVHDFFGVAVDDEGNGFFGRDAALVAVEELVFGDFGCCGFVLDDGGVVEDVDIRECVSAAGGAEQE
jgi:hypothetical protein